MQNIKKNIEVEVERVRQETERKRQEKKELEESEDFNWTNFHVLATIDFDEDSQQNYAKKKKTRITQISPITGQEIPIEEFDEHLRYQLKHPQYQKELEEIKQRREQQNSALATGEEIAKNLLQGNQSKTPDPDAIIWDGREESIPSIVSHAIQTAKRTEAAHPEMKKEPRAIGPRLPR